MQDIPLTPTSAKNTSAGSWHLSDKTNILVTGLLHRGEEKAVCVMVEEDDRSVEIRLPAGEILSNHGFTDGEVNEILSYLNENMDDIRAVAGKINPMKAFMS